MSILFNYVNQDNTTNIRILVLRLCYLVAFFVTLILVCVFISQLVFICRSLIVLGVVGSAPLCIIQILATVAHNCMVVHVVSKFNIYTCLLVSCKFYTMRLYFIIFQDVLIGSVSSALTGEYMALQFSSRNMF